MTTRRIPLRAKIAAALGSAVVVLLVGAAATLSSRQTRVVLAWVQHTYAVIGLLQGVSGRASDAETAQHDFSLTGEARAWSAYDSAVADVRRLATRVRIATGDDPDQQARAMRLTSLAEKLSVTNVDAPPVLPVQIRAVVRDMVDHEERLLAVRDAKRQSDSLRTRAIIIAGSILAFLLAVATSAALARAAEREQATATQLREQAAKLTETNAQLQQQADRERLARADAETARAAAEEANRAKSDFLRNMSHELRTPLNAIAGYAELLSMGIRGPVTDAQVADLDAIRRSEQHLLSLINAVLAFARLEGSQEQYTLEPVSAWEIVAGVESLVHPQMQAKGLVYHSRCDCPRPGCAAYADRDKLTQILVNLLSNAMKFTDRGGEVTVSCEADTLRVRIRVRDTGRGIPAAELDRIFEPFVQLNRQLSRPADGMGLGLSISRDLARGMGGDLTADSEPGGGSTFTVHLPTSPVRASVRRTARAATPGTTG